MWVSENNGACLFFGGSAVFSDKTICSWNTAHRRPWLTLRIEYQSAFVFYAFARVFLKSHVYTHSVADFHAEFTRMAFSPQRNDNFTAFLK